MFRHVPAPDRPTEPGRGPTQKTAMKTIARIPTLFAALTLTLAPAGAAVDFAKDVVPILQSRCVECHGPDKQKGKLRLDTKADFFKGGKDGEIVKPGNAGESDLVKRTLLPSDNDDRMPPKGEALTAAQIEVLKSWVNEGAKWPDGVVVPAPVQARRDDLAIRVASTWRPPPCGSRRAARRSVPGAHASFARRPNGQW